VYEGIKKCVLDKSAPVHIKYCTYGIGVPLNGSLPSFSFSQFGLVLRNSVGVCRYMYTRVATVQG